MADNPGGHANRVVLEFWGEPVPPWTKESVETHNQTLTDAAADYAEAIRTGHKSAQRTAAKRLHAWFDDEERALFGAEQGAADPYIELYLRGVGLVLKASRDQADGLYERAVEWALRLRAFCRHCAVGWAVRSPGARVGSPKSRTRDDVYRGLVTGKPFAAGRSGYDQARAMWSHLLATDDRFRKALATQKETEVRLLWPMEVWRYEHGVITVCRNLSSHPSGRGKPQAWGFPTWACAHDAAGRLEVVSWFNLKPPGVDGKKFGKQWGSRSRLIPFDPPSSWPAMGKLVESYVIDLKGRHALDGEPVAPLPPVKPPVEPAPPPPTEPPSEPGEGWTLPLGWQLSDPVKEQPLRLLSGAAGSGEITLRGVGRGDPPMEVTVDVGGPGHPLAAVSVPDGRHLLDVTVQGRPTTLVVETRRQMIYFIREHTRRGRR